VECGRGGSNPDAGDDSDQQTTVVQAARVYRVNDGDVALERDDGEDGDRRRVAGALHVVVQLAHRLPAHTASRKSLHCTTDHASHARSV